MSVLVTGGAGFIGSHLLDALAAQGRRAVCLDNFNDYYPPALKRRNIRGALATGLVELVEGDICDLELCRRVFERHGVRRVVHLAARAGVRPSIEQPLPTCSSVHARRAWRCSSSAPAAPSTG